MFVRVPKQPWADLSARPGQLAIHPLAERLDTLGNPSFLARRQQHQTFDASIALALPQAGTAAGLVAFQNGTHWYFLGVRRAAKTGAEVFLETRSGEGASRILAMRSAGQAEALKLKIEGEKGAYAFAFDAGDGKGWQWLARDVDGTVLSTDVAGGFVGATLGPYARDERAR